MQKSLPEMKQAITLMWKTNRCGKENQQHEDEKTSCGKKSKAFNQSPRRKKGFWSRLFS
jgi:hypothetical protein